MALDLNRTMEPIKPRTHSELVTAGQLAVGDRQMERAQERALNRYEADDDKKLRKKDPETGQFVAKLTHEDWVRILERIENGEIEARICRDEGICRAAIHAKRRTDPQFSAAYDRACFNGYVNVAHDIRATVRGEEGYSTGDVRRDELVAKYDFELAKKFASKIMGDKPMIDAEKIIIQLPSGYDFG